MFKKYNENFQIFLDFSNCYNWPKKVDSGFSTNFNANFNNFNEITGFLSNPSILVKWNILINLSMFKEVFI